MTTEDKKEIDEYIERIEYIRIKVCRYSESLQHAINIDKNIIEINKNQQLERIATNLRK